SRPFMLLFRPERHPSGGVAPERFCQVKIVGTQQPRGTHPACRRKRNPSCPISEARFVQQLRQPDAPSRQLLLYHRPGAALIYPIPATRPSTVRFPPPADAQSESNKGPVMGPLNRPSRPR